MWCPPHFLRMLPLNLIFPHSKHVNVLTKWSCPPHFWGWINALDWMSHPLYLPQGPSLLSHWQIWHWHGLPCITLLTVTSIVSRRCDSCVRHFSPIVQQVIGTVYQCVSLLWLSGESFYTNCHCQSTKWLWWASIYMNCMTMTQQCRGEGDR